MPMAATRAWTLDDLDTLPDDGNKYEVVRGELLVTPAPSVTHELVIVRLRGLLMPYVRAHQLGDVFQARAAFQFRGSQVEPDLMVRRVDPGHTWETAPAPSLIAEVVSPTTRRREHDHKRGLYSDAGIAEYWIIDPEDRTIAAVRPDQVDTGCRDAIRWWPAGAAAPLDLALADVFG